MITQNSPEEVRRAWQIFIGVEPDGKFGPRTTAATKRFQCENGLRADGTVGANTLTIAKQNGFVMPKTAETLDNARIDVCLPESGTGFCGYNRERNGSDQYGTAFTIGAIIELAAEWHKAHSDIAIQIGDIARRGGGAFPPHASHKNGRDFDVRPIRRDKKMLPVDVRTAEYDADLTKEFVELVRRSYPNAIIYFNDPVLIKKGLTIFCAGHYNHLHFRLK